jgi:hypothetical protein
MSKYIYEISILRKYLCERSHTYLLNKLRVLCGRALFFFAHIFTDCKLAPCVSRQHHESEILRIYIYVIKLGTGACILGIQDWITQSAHRESKKSKKE